jgi:hypothetical protein
MFVEFDRFVSCDKLIIEYMLIDQFIQYFILFSNQMIIVYIIKL